MARNIRDLTRERLWRERVTTWSKSGLGIREFCRRYTIPETSFHFWRRELRTREQSTTAVATTSKSRFIPVTVIPSTEVTCGAPNCCRNFSRIRTV